jgi:error-prone DNA polymerase
VFAELHAASAFSFLEGASLPEVLAEVCAQLEIPAMALLDRDGFYGSPRFHLAAQKRGIKAHVGAEVTCTDGARYPLLAESRKGYQNLCRLITRYKMRAPKGEGAATPEEIAEFSEGLICLAGGEHGPTLESAVLLFGTKQVYGELQRHYLRDEEARNQAILEKAARLHIPVIATNGVKHAVPSERQLLDALTCVREKVRLENAGKLLTRNAERYLKHEGKMRELFRDLPRAVDQTKELSERLEFTLSDLGYRFPDYPVPPGETMASFLRAQVEKGAQDRYRPYHDRARQQIQKELDLIIKLHLEGYFLIVWDIVEFCRKAGILVQGRGSAANSAVCYSLGITAVDPVGMDLLFERFLSEERGEWPDIDLDLPSGDRREKAIQFLYEKYGERGAAMTANVITYRGRSAAREIGKVLGFEESTVARLASLVRAWEWKDPNDTPERQFRDAGFDLADPHIRKFFELYLAAQDLPRHLGQHSGGMIVCQGRLDEVVPIENAAMPGRAVVQWDKDDCADMGMLKIDLLGLGMMAVLEDCLTIIRDSSGEEVSLAHLPPNDEKVYDALQRADTIGLFQVESRAQMATLPRMKPKNFYDIVVEVAIIRPGPIVGKMLHPYLRRRQGLEAPDALHPLLAPVLDRTLGVPIFQEQLLRMAMIVAGFSGGEAEELRRAFGFKRSEKRMAEVEIKLREGMNRNGITGEVQDRIIQSITSFALYGFPESHAASFALIAYASAYLKTHFLPAFTAAILNNQPMGFYHPATLVKDAQRHGLRVLPVDITKSNWLCTLEKQGDEWAMRLGFRYVRGLREEAGKAIEEERQHAPFTSIENLAGRVPELHRDELRMLAKVGALNFINSVHRRDALWEAERVSRPVGPLLSHLEAVEAHSPLRPMNVRERLHADFTGTGVTVGKHPMAFYREQLKRRGVLTAIELKKQRDGALVKVAGAVICRQRPGTAKGFFFISMEDETGISNVIVNPDQFERNRQVLIGKSFLVVEGILQNWDGVSVKMGRVEALEQNPIPVPSHDFH